jgi:hypothetical protein
MTVTPWADEVKNRKVLTIFPMKKVTDNRAWLQVFKDAIAEFNKISTDAAPNLTFASPPDVKRPDPVGDDGAEVQFDLGNGKLEYEAVGQKFVARDSTTNQPINYSPTALHGCTEQLKLSSGGPFRIRRAFIFVPATPMIGAAMSVGKGPDDFRTVQRLAAAASGFTSRSMSCSRLWTFEQRAYLHGAPRRYFRHQH